MAESQITVRVTTDENKVPTAINWSADDSDVANQTPTTLIERQFLGAQQRLHLLCGTTTLSLESASPPEIITHVALHPTHIHLFNR